MNRSPEREDWRREHSLLELGSAVHSEDHSGPDHQSLMPADDRIEAEEPFDVRLRHRLARAQREAIEDVNQPFSLPEPQWPQEDGDRRAPPSPIQGGRDEDWSGPDTSGNRPRRRSLSWRLVAAGTALGLLMGGAVAFSLPARYQATAGLTLGASDLNGGAVESQLRLLTSGIVLTRVVDGLNLASDPEFNGRESGAGGITGMLRALLVRDGGGAADEGHRQALAVDRLLAALSVSHAAGGGIAVTATTGNGEKSALIANAVADAFVQVHDKDRSGAVTGSAADTQTGDAAAAAARDHLDDFANANDRPDLAKDPARIIGILDLDTDLKEARAHTEALNAKVSELRSTNVDSLGGGLPPEFETGAVQALRTQYLDIKRQADLAAARLGPRNPERHAIEAQLAGARSRLAAELRRIVAAQQARLKEAVETEQALASRLARTGLSVQDIAALRDIQKERAAAEVDRQTMTGSIAVSGDDAKGQGAEIVSRATPPTKPSGPPRLTITLAGAALGLFAGLGLGAGRGRHGGPQTPAERDARTLFEAGSGRKKRWRRDSRPVAGSEEWDEPGRPQDDDEAWPLPDEALPLPTAIMEPTETNMYPVHPDQLYAQDPQQPRPQPRFQPQQWQQPAYSPAASYAPAPYAAQPYPQPFYPPHPTMQPMPSYPVQAWPAATAAPLPWPYAAPAHPYAGPAHPVQYAQPAPDMWQRPAIDQEALDEIRASLHEFREALRDLADSRPRRRFL
jgi:uncharacterized protein involved in exopolysaccharide biosynthesis